MTFELALRLAAVFACGVVIGLERQIRRRTTGLRTITLVASGACLFVLRGVLTGNDMASARGFPRRRCPASGFPAAA